MLEQVKVPLLPESVTDATIITWHKKVGDTVRRDENLVDLETDKVVLEVPSPQDGILKEVLQAEGTIVVANDLLAVIEPSTAGVSLAAPKDSESRQVSVDVAQAVGPIEIQRLLSQLSPAVRRLITEHNLDPANILGTGKGGRLTKSDIENFLVQQRRESVVPPTPPNSPATLQPSTAIDLIGERPEKRVPMSRLRARIAERLVVAQHNAALLTTFNEVNLQAVMDIRAAYKERFEKLHGVKLGFMSFFTQSVIEALKRFPSVNASIDGKDIIYHGFYDIGIAVSTERGLVVPVLRNADKLSMADIENTILDFAKRARDNKLGMEELQGGTFTITNGGVFGSLISTPIINPPQTGILGMHKIQQRPVVEKGEIVIRPMMYLALSYDHRLIDGKESVQFLMTIKELLEDPTRLLLDL